MLCSYELKVALIIQLYDMLFTFLMIKHAWSNPSFLQVLSWICADYLIKSSRSLSSGASSPLEAKETSEFSSSKRIQMPLKYHRTLSFRQVKESPKATNKQGVQKNKKTLSLFSHPLLSLFFQESKNTSSL